MNLAAFLTIRRIVMFGKNDRIVFVGDSITDSGRNYDALPAGWSSWGEGYVHLINAFTTGVHPEKELMIVNQGISGNRITDLKQRWEKDVMGLSPDWVNIMIGVNDVWRHFDSTFSQEKQVDMDMFEKIYEELIVTTQSKVKGIILIGAFMVEANRQDAMREKLEQYNNVTKKLAEKYNLLYVDIQTVMDHFTRYQSSYVLSSDRVHPSTAGHLLIAREWIKSVGLEW